MTKLKKPLFRILTLLAFGGGIGVLLAIMIESFIFFPEKEFGEIPQDYGLDYENVSIITPDQVSLHGWYLKGAPSRGTLLMFHGNAGNISHRLFKVAPFVKRGFSVLMIDYRGFA